MSTLILDNVTVSRGAGPVIRSVGLRVESGTITALVGPNGAGKTSLLESISGVIDASSGSITMLTDDQPNGVELRKLSRVRRAKLGLVHIEQGRAVFPSLTVIENIRLTAGTQGRLDDAFDMFPELRKRAKNPAGLLSGGEQQMLVLARAFASAPKFLLIDEMSLGLAPVVFKRLLPMVKNFSEAGVGVLLVEQFTALALDLAKEALVVSGGRVSYQGAAAELKASPALLHSAYLGISSAA